ncbi:hypothetical protein TNCV_2666691 [Trichonephila clavipes]|nr:hypothetical protein TNCV_2666691 [Trichonephila clavipes]
MVALLQALGRKTSQRLPGLREKKEVVSYEDLLLIKGAKYSIFQEAERAEGLSKSDDLVDEVLDDATSLMNLREKDRQEQIL